MKNINELINYELKKYKYISYIYINGIYEIRTLENDLLFRFILFDNKDFVTALILANKYNKEEYLKK